MNSDFAKVLWIVLKRNVLIFTLLAVLTLVYVVTNQEPLPEVTVPEQVFDEQQETATFEYSEPMHLRIPAIDVDVAFEAPLGVDVNQEIEVPKSYDTVGWYKYGPTPGELGPAVVLGHVDSFEGPEVFYNLRNLTEGDHIEIDREDGTIALFEVTQLTTVSQSSFPTDEVYGNIDFAGLRLITCSGAYDHGTQRYSHNLIVFAKLVESESIEN